MNVPFVDLKAQYQSIKTEIEEAISKVLSNSDFIGGQAISDFESSFAKYIGVDHCVGCANGTDAIEIALEALGVGVGDEVIVPACTWISTASAVNRVGATPVLVDIDPIYFTIDPLGIENAINSKTKAIIPVHLYGCPADMLAIDIIAKKHKLFVIEDCAQAHGAEIDGKKVGSFGDVAAFSFYPGKNLGAYGDAGCIVTNNASLAEECRVIAKLGQKGKHNHIRIGRNSRLDTLQAAILNVKLKYLDEWTHARIKNAQLYCQVLKELPIILPSCQDGNKHCYHLFVVQTDVRDELKVHLNKNGISALVHYPKPLHQLSFYNQMGYKCPNADSLKAKILSLPMFPELNLEQVNYIGQSITRFFE